MAFCMKCGNEVPDGMKFCGSCGAPMDNDNGASKQNKVKKKSKHILLKIIGIIVLLFILFVVFVNIIANIGDDNTDSETTDNGAEITENVQDEDNAQNSDDVNTGNAETVESTDTVGYTEYLVGDIIFRIPDEYDNIDKEKSSYQFKSKHSLIWVGAKSYKNEITNDMLIEQPEKVYAMMDDAIGKVLDVYENIESDIITLFDNTAFVGNYEGSYADNSLSAEIYLSNREDIKECIFFVFFTEDGYSDEYKDVYAEIINTARINDGTFESATDEADSEVPAGVDPDLKEFLDSYEDFMDEYVEFMNDYISNPGNVISMLNEYTDMVNELEDFEKKADAYNPDEMSAADSAYYLEVTMRIEKKLLNVLN